MKCESVEVSSSSRTVPVGWRPQRHGAIPDLLGGETGSMIDPGQIRES